MTGGAGDRGRAPNRVHMSVPAMNRKPPKFPLKFRAPRCKAFLKGDRAEFAGFALDSATANERRRPSGPQCLHRNSLWTASARGAHRSGRAQLLTRTGIDWTEKYPVGCRDGEGPGEDGLSRGRAVRGLGRATSRLFPELAERSRASPACSNGMEGLKGIWPQKATFPPRRSLRPNS